MDAECVQLCDAMNALPGVETTESCCGHGKSEFHVWFKVTNPRGLFFITRCTDRRYWRYGYKWRIELSVGDRYENGYLPVDYLLTSIGVMGDEAYEQAKDLVRNMNYHLNHKNFCKGYELNLCAFDIIR
jgi:hypothetical protein